ncbi:hypothetical protein HOLleu_39188 [Holothuria leucospilota]|uniref:Uncharacterized protein n=1 Tax=Holothuria leucospilota TaxID=206669 RepID=A0A9Q0YN18_HOLLE|nr:hypothetical protein HOLleu_39188 [Holothuria leucospilota]
MRLLVVAALCTIAFARVADPAQNVEIDTPGNYFWFPSPLPGETCTIKFQVQATRDAVMTFSTQKSLNNHVYQASKFNISLLVVAN